MLSYTVPFASVFLAHYISSNLYTTICVPPTFLGFLQSFVIAGSPACGVLLQIMTATHTSHGLLLGGLGTAIVYRLSKMRCTHDTKESRHSK